MTTGETGGRLGVDWGRAARDSGFCKVQMNEAVVLLIFCG